MITEQDIQPFASLLAKEQKERLIAEGMTWEVHAHNYAVTVKVKKKFACVDVGSSGRYLVMLETGEIIGIKAYGVPNYLHRFGTLDTIHEWDWRGYRAVPIARTFASAPIN